MLETKDIEIRFDSLFEFETFRVDWTRACARINRTGKNGMRLDATEYRAKAMKMEGRI